MKNNMNEKNLQQYAHLYIETNDTSGTNDSGGWKNFKKHVSRSFCVAFNGII
jgi:hypothetical protein